MNQTLPSTFQQIFQSNREFDREESQFRRTFVLIDQLGKVYVSNMPEGLFKGMESIKDSKTCWQSITCIGNEITKLEFARKHSANNIYLEIKIVGGLLKIHDPIQDEWGGFSGVYEPIAD